MLTVNQTTPSCYSEDCKNRLGTWDPQLFEDITFSIEEEQDPTNQFGLLVSRLKLVLGSDRGLTSEEIDADVIIKMMEQYHSDESEWGKYALADLTRGYSRNLVVNINHNANLLILVWSPGKGSAIHDHAQAHCCMKVIKGKLRECLYDLPGEEGQPLVLKKETVLDRNDVGYINDSIGLHRIKNELDDQISISLHLYTPPYAALHGCCMYEFETGKKHHVNMSKYYALQGKVVGTKNASTC
ncbi:uncharacterized protein KQ657_004331 [Scheffersomyces spartinae]|uniref:Cysteine dioxygenase n=1 Tax=Scheffersomyces spartinae TaxID=45513 RepID=A0A9P8AJD3_9ASCO|nr:uncharacterized protein KQ657_004331 [Scheffersomyces spartinae]KAG7194655.1 hypothetical protein KQ657_004331 [Scheffersomyces spartinae]